MASRPAPPVIRGQNVEVTATQLVAGGAAIARIDGFPIFITGAYPGDSLRVEITEVKSGFARGEMLALLTPSPDRRIVSCPIARECGGCDWTELRLDVQLRWKREILLDSLRRVGKIDVAELPPMTIHPSPLNYRVRSRLHRSDSNPADVGFFAMKSHEVVPLSEACEIVDPSLITNLEMIRAAGGSEIETFANDIDFVARPLTDSRSDGLPVSIDVRGFHYDLSTSAFFQVNRHLLGTLIALVQKHAARAQRKSVALDLYAGVGFFTLPLAREFERVISVEESPLAHRYAKQNAAGLTNVRVRKDDVEAFLARGPGDADFIMADPPRAGLTRAVIDGINATNAATITYLACDPVTFARDLSLFTRHGWSVRSLDLIDLFPNTHHVETLASLVRG